MGSFASKELTPQEQMRQYKREVDRAIRELDRERAKLERQNEKLVLDIKKAAKANQVTVAKIMAKDYVRTKRHVQKFMQLRTYLQGIGLQLQTMKSVDAMATAMKNATRAMRVMNARLNIPQLQSVMRTFGIESEHMEATTEMMGETMDGIFEVEDEEAEESSVLAQITEELKLEWPEAPIGTAAIPSGAKVATTAAPAAKTAVAGGGGAVGGGPSTGAAGGAGDGKGGPGSGGAGGGGGGMPAAGGAGTGASAPGGGSGGDLAARLAALRAGGGGAGGASGGAGSS